MRTGRILIIAAIALVLGTGFGALLWLYYRDPLSSLPQPQHQVWADRTAPVLHSRRSLEHITLHNTALGDIGITVSLPNPLPDKKLPILVVLGVLEQARTISATSQTQVTTRSSAMTGRCQCDSMAGSRH